MKTTALISALVAAKLSLAAPNPAPTANPDPSPVAEPAPVAVPDPQWRDLVGGLLEGIGTGLTAGIASGLAAGIENPGDFGDAFAAGLSTALQTGISEVVGNVFGFAEAGYCDSCPRVQCNGINACQCQNVATLTCWVSSGFSCRRPAVSSCSGQSPTGNNAQYASCGRGLPACPSGSICDRSLTAGCIDLSNSGNCIGVCLPQYAPYSPAQNPYNPVQNPSTPQPTVMTPSPARKQCRGPGYDEDCTGANSVCVPDPAAPMNANVPGVCVNPSSSCGGTQMRACTSGKICIDDPRDACSPGSSGCLGICI